MKTLNVEECASFLHVNATTVAELAGSGLLPGAKIGRAWIFLEDDLIEYVRSEVKRQQSERQRKVKSKSAHFTNVDIVSSLPTTTKPRGRRTPLPNLDNLP